MKQNSPRTVGRCDELALLRNALAAVGDGPGRALEILGEPGIGKSRIAAELEIRLRVEQHLRLRYFCSPYHQDSDHLLREAGHTGGYVNRLPLCLLGTSPLLARSRWIFCDRFSIREKNRPPPQTR